MDTLKKRQTELERQSVVSGIEAKCLELDVSKSETFEIKDLQTYQRIRTRFYRLKNETGRIYETIIDGDTVTITRTA